jgi:hypothetical protein
MVAININGNQTLIPLSMFTKLLQQKYSTTQPSTTTVGREFFVQIYFISLFKPSTNGTQQTPSTQIIQNGSSQNSKEYIFVEVFELVPFVSQVRDLFFYRIHLQLEQHFDLFVHLVHQLIVPHQS